jgi:hypothetical protein
VIVLDKLDYCSSVKNFDALKGCSNFKVRGIGEAMEKYSS